MIEYNILCDLHQHGGSMGYVELLNSQHEQRNTDPVTTAQILKHLLSLKYISGKLDAYSTIRMEPAGVAFLDQCEENLSQAKQDRADKIANEKRERFTSVALVILGELLAFALGILTHILIS